MNQVSVILPVYGHEPHLRDSIQSIQEQTYEDIELLLILEDVDARTRQQISVIDDSNATVIEVPPDTGLSEALNTGIQEADGEFIARQDADDLSDPHRLERQVSYLEKNQEIGLLGTASEHVDSVGNVRGTFDPPGLDSVLRWESFFSCPFIHSSVMFRQTVVEQLNTCYRSGKRFELAEDYDLWCRMMAHTRIANLQERLVQYREHEASISQQSSERQLSNFVKLATEHINRELPELEVGSEDIQQIHTEIYRGQKYGTGNHSVQCAVVNEYLDILEKYLQSVSKKGEVARFASLRVLKTLFPPCSIHCLRTYLRPFLLAPDVMIDVFQEVVRRKAGRM
jgi:glycosyltransferase involved in cell wall biosynthesis